MEAQDPRALTKKGLFEESWWVPDPRVLTCDDETGSLLFEHYISVQIIPYQTCLLGQQVSFQTPQSATELEGESESLTMIKKSMTHNLFGKERKKIFFTQ